MYYDYFGLKQAPFKITPDTSLFFPGGDRGATLDALIYAIVSGEGIVKLVGEVGSGKTILCRMLEKELPENIEIVYLANPSLSPDNILHAIAFELNLNVKSDDSRLKVMNSLQNYLLERHAENKQIVIFIEEAQSMPIATLEEIRLLSNLETSQNKLLQIVIFGQPELDVMISKPEIRQLKERITYSFYLSPFKLDEVKDYINSRLRLCGYRSVGLFSEQAIKIISKHSGGLLRRINILADKALLACYADNENTIRVKHVKLAVRETEFVNKLQFPFFRWGLISFSTLIVVTLLMLLPDINILPTGLEEVKHEEHNVSSAIIEDANLSTSADTSLMLMKEVRETKNSTFLQPINDFDDMTENEIVDSDVANQQEKIFIARPDPNELEMAQWQITGQTAFFYPEPVNEAEIITRREGNINESGLLEIHDLMKAAGKHCNNDMALLYQFVILPAETAINNRTVTDELCHTTIYRPLKDDKKL